MNKMGGEEFTSKVEAFDIHRRIYSTMTLLGVYKWHSPNQYLERLHFIYRMIVFVTVFIINMQHLIYFYDIFLNSSDLVFIVEAFIEEISHLNFFGKLFALTLNSSKLDALHALIKDPIFAPENKKDEEYIKKYKKQALTLYKLVNGFMTFSMSLWIVNRLLKKFENPDFSIPAYFPFDTRPWSGFLCSVVFETVGAIWTGYGHYSLDCMIASYYMQATSQLKSIKYKLRHVFDDQETAMTVTRRTKYKDEVDGNIYKRFIYCVRRYENISWFIHQVNSTLYLGISVNLLTLSLAMCLIVYGLRMMNVFTVAFIFMAAALFVYQAENFIYCYFGHLVQHESDSVNTAIYFSDWLSVSPKFRRQILIAMSRWHYRVIPRVSSVVPVSLTTFVAVTRLAYTIYTVMRSYEGKNN